MPNNPDNGCSFCLRMNQAFSSSGTGGGARSASVIGSPDASHCCLSCANSSTVDFRHAKADTPTANARPINTAATKTMRRIRDVFLFLFSTAELSAFASLRSEAASRLMIVSFRDWFEKTI